MTTGRINQVARPPRRRTPLGQALHVEAQALRGPNVVSSRAADNKTIRVEAGDTNAPEAH